MKKLKVGLVGFRGGRGRGGGYGELFNSHPRTEVAAICDINQNCLEEGAKYLGLKDSNCFQSYDDFVNSDIDIVFIGTPIPFHASQSIKALESGKHVLCEVTAANTIEDCEKLVQTVKKTKKKYMMAENYCYFYYIQEWKNIVQKGRIGKVYYAEGEYVHEIRDRIINPETGESYWRANRPPLHYCSHSLGPLLMLLDDRIVKATGSGKGINIIPDVGPGAIDIQVGLFETAKGTTIKLLRSSVATRKPEVIFYSIYGTKGFLETGRGGWETEGKIYIEGEDNEARTIICSCSDPSAPEEAKKGGHGTSEYFLIRDFITAIDGDTTPPIDVVKAVDMTIPGIIAHEAAMRGNVWIDVPHFE